MFELVDATNQTAIIKVIGVGGGGGNAVEQGEALEAQVVFVPNPAVRLAPLS